MKLTGLLLIAASFIFFALVRLKLIKDRIQIIHKALLFIQSIKRELAAEPVPMPEMFYNIAQKLGSGENAVFAKLSEDMDMLGEKSFYEIWKDNITKYFPGLLENEEFELIKLGSSLGIYAVEIQIENITRCEIYLAEIMQKEKEAYPQIHRLYMGLSAAAAAALIIVFI